MKVCLWSTLPDPGAISSAIFTGGTWAGIVEGTAIPNDGLSYLERDLTPTSTKVQLVIQSRFGAVVPYAQVDAEWVPMARIADGDLGDVDDPNALPDDYSGELGITPGEVSGGSRPWRTA